MIDFYFERSGVCENVFFGRRMGAVIFEFPSSVCDLCAWGEHFNDEAWGVDRLDCPSVAWIAGDDHIRVEVACVRDVDFHVGTINTAVSPTQKVPKNSLDV